MKTPEQRIKEIIDVLEFYANDKNHDEKYRSIFNSEYYQSEVMIDGGERARAILESLVLVTEEEESQ